MSAPTYRERLRLEGAVLTACGAIATVVLLLTSSQTTRGPVSTVSQLAILAALLIGLGPRGVRRAIDASTQVTGDAVGSGEPTPLWHIAAIVVGLTVLAGEVAGWDAGLRVTVGCMLVGITQCVLLRAIVGNAERADGRTYYRVAGSRILRGTRLGYACDTAVPDDLAAGARRR